MTNTKRVLIFFVGFICLIYLYGLLHGMVYQSTLNDTTSITIDKASFFDVNDLTNNIANRELTLDDKKTIHYVYNFTRKDLDTLKFTEGVNENIYFMIEKPDAQYMAIEFNGITIGRFGDENGQSNIWNGTFYVMLNEVQLREENELSITMTSDYMTGVSGKMKLMLYDEYKMMSSYSRYSEQLIHTASDIAFVIAVIIGLMMIAWYKTLYNIKVYLYFCLSILFIGITMFDYRVTHHIPIDYLIYKKGIVLSYHLSVTFAALAIAYLLNAKYKINIGMLGVTLIVIQMMRTTHMIAWRDSYQLLNIFLVMTIVQLLITLIYYRKRADNSAFVLIAAFFFACLSVIKLVYITGTTKESGTLMDMPILTIMFAAVVLFVFYIELTSVAGHQDMDIEKSLTLNGSFSIDKNLIVVGQYSNTCDEIFDQLIIGKPIKQLLFHEEYAFNKDILMSIFDSKYAFVEGFIDLLPTQVTINNRDYIIGYSLNERIERLLKITLSDVTQIKALEEALEEQKHQQRFFINALKSKQELGYFIDRTKNFLKTVRIEGFAYEHQIELHTLKGNLGQFGFMKFEKAVHDVEDALTGEYDALQLVNQLEEGLKEAIELLEKHIGKTCFENSYLEYAVKKSDIIALENHYLAMEDVNESFLHQLRELRLIDLKHMLSRYNNYVSQLAHELNKSVLPLDIYGDSVMVQPEKAEAFVMSLVAIFRNSLVHGIETAEERVSNNKDSFAFIRCHLKQYDDTIELLVEDDGRGVHHIALLKKAREQGLISESENFTDDIMAQLILNSRLSSQNEADKLSGRGIGLTAVYDATLAMQGTIDLKSNEGQGTQIIIKIPYKSFRE